MPGAASLAKVGATGGLRRPAWSWSETASTTRSRRRWPRRRGGAHAGAPVRRPGRDHRPGHGRARDPGGRARCGHGGGAAGRRRPAVGDRLRDQAAASARCGWWACQAAGCAPYVSSLREGRNRAGASDHDDRRRDRRQAAGRDHIRPSSASTWTTSSPSPTPRSARASCTWWSARRRWWRGPAWSGWRRFWPAALTGRKVSCGAVGRQHRHAAADAGDPLRPHQTRAATWCCARA